MDPLMHSLLSHTLRTCLSPDAQITHIMEIPFTQSGYAGAEMHLFEVQLLAGPGGVKTVPLLVKNAPLHERLALTTLYQQGHALIPYAYAPDLVHDGPAPICMQYIQADPEISGPTFLNRTARELASLHFRNLGNRKPLAWAPPADTSFFAGGYVLQTWRTAWNELMADSDFAAEFNPYGQPLEDAAADFLTTMEALWEEGETLTLIHGDLHDGNVVAANGNPYIVDWGQAHYGTFYIDLPNLLSRAEIRTYYESITQLGYSLSEDTFFERYCQAGRYVGFKYMAFVMAGWADRDQPGSMVRPHMHNLIHLALNGA
jgi:hypothetical protein